MCLKATVLFSAFCLGNKDVHIQRFSTISVIDCKSVFDFATKPGAPTGIDKRCAVNMAIIRGCLRREEGEGGGREGGDSLGDRRV